MTTIIDAANSIVGRIASHAAQRALLGDEVKIINCEKAVISGSKDGIQQKYIGKRNRGQPMRGPHVPRQSDRFVRRIVRGMLPFKTIRGQNAFRRVLCYVGAPIGMEKGISIKTADANKLPNNKYITIGQLTAWLGGKR